MAFRLASGNWTGSFGVYMMLLAGLAFFGLSGNLVFLAMGIALCLFILVKGLSEERRQPHLPVLVTLCLTTAGAMFAAMMPEMVPAALVLALPWIAGLARGWFVWRLSPRGPMMVVYLLIAFAPLIELVILPNVFGASLHDMIFGEEINGRAVTVDLSHLVLPLELLATGLTLLLLQHRR